MRFMCVPWRFHKLTNQISRAWCFLVCRMCFIFVLCNNKNCYLLRCSPSGQSPLIGNSPRATCLLTCVPQASERRPLAHQMNFDHHSTVCLQSYSCPLKWLWYHAGGCRNLFHAESDIWYIQDHYRVKQGVSFSCKCQSATAVIKSAQPASSRAGLHSLYIRRSPFE